MSGTAIADAAGLGTIEIKAMKDHGYTTEFAVGVTAASATLGPIIPPSLPFVIYGMMANVSIGALFLGGIIPGIVMTLFMMVYVVYCARRDGIPRDAMFRWRVLGLTFLGALPALMTPVIIIGGMTFGWFTPTEAAIAACTWALILGVFLYRSLSLEALLQGDARHHRDDRRRAPHRRRRLAVRLGADDDAAHRGRRRRAPVGCTANQYVILLLINLLLLVVGCFLETIASITILVPVLMPVARQGRHRPGPFRRRHDAEPDDRPAAPAARHGAVRAGADLEAVDRAHHHGDPALAPAAPRLARRDHAHPRADAVAAAARSGS